MGLYDDIIDKARPAFPRYKRMSMQDRAAQFMPFAALRGYEENIQEASRTVAQKRVLSEERMRVLDERLALLSERISMRPKVRIVCFVADETKEGGTYVAREGCVRRVDYFARDLVFEDRTTVSFDDLYRIEGEVFDRVGSESVTL